MSENLYQIFTANPASTMRPTDLLYLARSPYISGNDFAITFSNFLTSINAVKLTPVTDQLITGAYSLGANNFLPGSVTITTSITTINLTAASPQVLYFIGSSAQILKMPDVTTLQNSATNTTTYTINNNSTGIIYAQSSGGSAIANILPGGTATIYLVSNTGTTNTSWFYSNTTGSVLLNPLSDQTISGNYNLYLTAGGVIAGSNTSPLAISPLGSVQSVGLSSGGLFAATGYFYITPSYITQKSLSTTQGTFVPVTPGTVLLNITATGDDGSSFITGGKLEFEVSSAVSGEIMPANFNVYTGRTDGYQDIGLTVDLNQNVIAPNGGYICGSSTGATQQSSLTLFSQTASKGSILFESVDNVGDYQNIFTSTNTTAARTWTLPDNTGTLALISDITNQCVLLNPLTSQAITAGDLILNSGSFTALTGGLTSGQASGGVQGNVVLYSNGSNLGSIAFFCTDSTGNFDGLLTNTSLTNNQTWTLPDATGVLSLTTDNVLLNPAGDQTINGNYDLILYGLTAYNSGLVGYTSGAYTLNTNGVFEVVGGATGGGSPTLAMSGFSGNQSQLVSITSNSTALGSYIPVNNGQGLHQYAVYGDDGYSYFTAAGYMEWAVGGAVSQGIVPGIFTMYVSDTTGNPKPIFYCDALSTFNMPQGVLNVGSANGSSSSNITLYSPTTSMGSLAISSVDNGGNYANVLTSASTTAAQTWTLPDVSGTLSIATDNVLLNPTGNQTINGNYDLTLYGLTATNSGLVGYTSGAYALNTNGVFEVVGGATGAGGSPTISMSGFGGNQSTLVSITSNSTIVNSYSAVNNGQVLHDYVIFADDGHSYFTAIAGYMEWTVDGTVSQNIIPGRFTMYVSDTTGYPNPIFYCDSLKTFNMPQGVLNVGSANGSSSSNITLYSPTTSMGSLAISSVNNGGNYANVLINASTTAAQTWTLPDATGNLLIDQSPNIITPTIVGITNGSSVAAGNVGEIITASGSGVSLTSTVEKNVVTITVTPGIWAISAGYTVEALATPLSRVYGGLTVTSSTLANLVSGVQFSVPTLENSIDFSVPTIYINVTTNTNVYLVVVADFVTGPTMGYGTITAVRFA